MDEHMDEDLIVLGAQAETPAAGGEDSHATETTPEVDTTNGAGDAATPGTDPAEPAADTPKPGPKADGEDDGEAEKPKKRTGITRMQDKIARLEAELAATRSAPTGDGGDRKAVIEKEIGAPPKEADFDDFVAYEDAKAEYRIRKALAEQRIADREVQAEGSRTRAQQEAVEAFEDRCDEAREKIADYDTVVASAKDAKVERHVAELVVESEKGGLLRYYLAKNPAELAKLNGMSPLQAAKAVGALEHRLTLAKPKKATSAPTPAKPVSGGAAPSTPEAEIDAWLAKTYGGRGSSR